MKTDHLFQLPQLDLADADVRGKEVAVIGATGDIGRVLAQVLTSLGGHVVVVGQTFRDTDVPNIEFIQMDLSLMSEARSVVARLPAESQVLLARAQVAQPA